MSSSSDTVVHADDLVSVIISTYRSGGSLEYALQSVEKQTHQRFEVIVVADGDPEDSEAVVNDMGDARFRYIRLEKNHGTQAVGNQAGLEVARGEWIAYLGHDDLWMPRHLEQLYAAASAARADFAYSLVCMVHPDGSVHVSGPPDASDTRIADAWFVQPSGWMHRKNVAARNGGWRMPGAWPVDVDFLHRARRCGVAFACSDNASVLKFLSWDYGSYARNARKPQKDYLSRLSDDPAALERDVLLAAARTLSLETYGGRDKIWTAARRFAWALITAMKHRTHDWPLMRSFWANAYRRRLLSARKRRGLDDE